MECRKILLVDDREENLYSLNRILAAIENIELLQTTEPEKALRLCLKHDFSLAILDVQMPGIDGYELAGLLRGNERTKELPIIFLSALSIEDHQVAKGYAIGATDFIVKPVRAEILIAKVKVFLQLDDSNRRLQELVDQRTQELSFSEARFRGTFENATIGIAHVDEVGNFIRVNPHLCSIVGYQPEEFIEKTFQEITHPEDLDKDLELFNRILKNEIDRYSMEKRYFRKDGNIVWIMLNVGVQKDQDGKVMYFIAVIENITEKKRINEALEKAKLEAESSNMAKTLFLANMSHELRTPLNPIIGLSEIMLQELPDEESLKNFLGIINNSGNHMLLLIEEILNFSKLQAGKVTSRLEWFNLFDPFDEVSQMLAEEIQKKGLQFIYEKPEELSGLMIYSDAVSLRQIIANLVGNAIKFTKSGFIELKVYFNKISESEGELHCEVNDSGVGIDNAHQKKIWAAFERVDNTLSSAEKGTGLGLSICQLQVLQLHGNIIVNSEPGKGSKFKFNIPVSFREKESSDHKTEDQAVDHVLENDSDSLKILSVDDDKSNQFVTFEMLKRLNHSCTCCYSAKEALELIDNQEFDLVLMDLKMPDMDGIECTRLMLEKFDNEPPFSVIALTANVIESAEIECAEAGMKGFLKKPLSAGALKSLLDEFQGNQATDFIIR